MAVNTERSIQGGGNDTVKRRNTTTANAELFVLVIENKVYGNGMRVEEK